MMFSLRSVSAVDGDGARQWVCLEQVDWAGEEYDVDNNKDARLKTRL